MLQQPQRHRHIKFACTQCRFRKLKCSGVHPCQRCSQLQLTCTFERTRQVRTVRGSRIELLREKQNSTRSPQPTSGPTILACESQAASTELPSLGDQQQPQDDRGPRRTSAIAEHASTLSFWGCARNSNDAITAPSPLASSTGSNSSDGEYPISADSGSATISHGPIQARVPRTGSISITMPVPVDASGSSFGSAQGQNDSPNPLSYSRGDQKEFVQTDSHVASAEDVDIVQTTSTFVPSDGLWLGSFQEVEILRWVNIFCDRLQPTVPILDCWMLQRDLLLRRHHRDVDFAAMILSLCSFALIQPVYTVEHPSMSFRKSLAKKMLSMASEMRTSFNFGENATLESTATSFFMFGALYGLDLLNAAWLRLREAVECGRLIGLDKPEAYTGLDTYEQAQRFKLFLILSVTERGFGLCKDKEISFTGRHLQRFAHVYDLVKCGTTSDISNIIVVDDHSSTALRGLLHLMRLYDTVDENVILCWNKKCSSSIQHCTYLTAERVCEIYHSIQNAIKSPMDGIRLEPSPRAEQRSTDSLTATSTHGPRLTKAQWADCLMLQQFMLIRLWTSCLTHELVDELSVYTFMRPSFAIDTAQYSLENCLNIGENALEIHGTGMIERISDLAMGVVMALQFLQGSEDESLKQRGTVVLTGYFQLLGRLRGGNHPYSSAVQQAYYSIH